MSLMHRMRTAKQALDNRHDYEDVFAEVKEINVLLKLWDAGVAYVGPKEDGEGYIFYAYRKTGDGTQQFFTMPTLEMQLQACRLFLSDKQDHE